MPELPEVETIKNELAPHILGHRIIGASFAWEGIVKQPSVEEFCSRLSGQVITGIERQGKYLIFRLSSGEALVIHLKMSGSLLLNQTDDRFIRATIHLNDGIKLYFRDPRKFGAMWLAKDENTIIPKLGPEPFKAGFTPEVLAELLRSRTAPIKALLCDQGFIAGVGNMYADEALFASRIHPLRSGGSLTREEVKKLYSAIKQVLAAGIGDKGASALNYFRPGGELGTAHHQFKVAHHGGEPCPNCGTPIRRLPIRNRGSYFCPKCQPVGK